MSDTTVAERRKTLSVVIGASIAVFVIGLLIDGMPSDDTDDTYWMLFVAPSAIAFTVGAVALAMLGWTYVPRTHGHDGQR